MGLAVLYLADFNQMRSLCDHSTNLRCVLMDHYPVDFLSQPKCHKSLAGLGIFCDWTLYELYLKFLAHDIPPVPLPVLQIADGLAAHSCDLLDGPEGSEGLHRCLGDIDLVTGAN